MFIQHVVCNFVLFFHAVKSRRIKCPVLVVHGYKDSIVPISQSRELIEAAAVPSFCPFWHKEGSHTDVESVDWYELKLYYAEFLHALRTGLLRSLPTRTKGEKIIRLLSTGCRSKQH